MSWSPLTILLVLVWTVRIGYAINKARLARKAAPQPAVETQRPIGALPARPQIGDYHQSSQP